MGRALSIFGLLLMFITVKTPSVGQDVQFSQFYASSTYINPAFAGSGHYARAHFHQRLQWPKLESQYVTNLIAIDKYFSDYDSGLGAYVFRDSQGEGTVSSTEFAVQYAYEVQLNKVMAVSLGLQAGVTHRYLDYSKLQFSYQYDDFGFNGLQHGLNGPSKIYPDFTSGFILYSDKFWFGGSWHHMSMPNLSVLGDRAPLPMKFSFMTGYKIKLHHDKYLTFESHEKDISITPTAHFKMQGTSSQLDLGVYVIYDHLLLGAWYRGIPVKRYDNRFQNNESIVLMGGWKIFRMLEISYSYDFTISTLQPARTGGAHELSANIILKRRRKKVKRRVECPSHHVIKSYDFF